MVPREEEVIRELRSCKCLIHEHSLAWVNGHRVARQKVARHLNVPAGLFLLWTESTSKKLRPAKLRQVRDLLIQIQAIYLQELLDRGEWQGELIQITKAREQVRVCSRWHAWRDEAGRWLGTCDVSRERQDDELRAFERSARLLTSISGSVTKSEQARRHSYSGREKPYDAQTMLLQLLNLVYDLEQASERINQVIRDPQFEELRSQFEDLRLVLERNSTALRAHIDKVTEPSADEVILCRWAG